MSSPHLGSAEPNRSHLETTSGETERPEVRAVLLALCVTIALATLVGGVYSLFALFRMRRKTSLCLIVASMSVDDLVSVVPLSLFTLLHWVRDGEREDSSPGTLCILSGVLYVFQGVSSNMKACLIAAYTFYITKRFGMLKSVHRPLTVVWAIAAVWLVSLVVSLLPLCGWGSFAPATLGCFPDRRSSYSLLLFSLYSACFSALLFFFGPLTYQLLCSREPQRTLFYPSYFELSRGLDSGSAPLCEFPSFSRDSLNTSFNAYSELSPVSFVTGPGLREDTGTCRPPGYSSEGPRDPSAGDSPVWFAQKRFSMILAVVRVILWMPIMTLVLLRHTTDARLPPLEALGFLLTLLAPAVTPLFALSERWNHLPCGCFIHCRRDPTGEPKALKRRFEFSLSFQQGYRVYKLSPAAHSPALTASTQNKPSSYHHLFHGDIHPEVSLNALDSGGLPPDARPEHGALDFSAAPPVDSSSRTDLRMETSVAAGGGGGGGGGAGGGVGEGPMEGGDVQIPPEVRGGGDEDGGGGGGGGDGLHHHSNHHREKEQGLTNAPPVFEAPERRLSHEEGRKIELSDWEWCRSKSERTPRQRSTGGLSVPLCAFQGTVSLQAPTGKTLSLSTYEVSSDGLKISPTNAKKVEVYRSKSVGHEPSADDPTGGGQAGDTGPGGGRTSLDLGMGLGLGLGMTVGMGSGVGDTNVKIHLEVLEICDNEEAMDSVSIVSNISQSSTHARSPSLRYSRRENRFVSCDLGETASYSLLIPSGGSPEADGLNISIPDTVEAHRQNSRRQTQDSSGYKEEIQLLNEAYLKQGRDEEE
ncbi:probable G-protein coupled receptor 149 [Gadus morhua]|uniref:G protein-coupled receptor 149 n=1 Tax=Gadus morhua TaxID=8049 RepID=A0A8C4ZJE5_GADMO|nr:probable G-protein coupled receptor 149 [Gadus morhua]